MMRTTRGTRSTYLYVSKGKRASIICRTKFITQLTIRGRFSALHVNCEGARVVSQKIKSFGHNKPYAYTQIPTYVLTRKARMY